MKLRRSLALLLAAFLLALCTACGAREYAAVTWDDIEDRSSTATELPEEPETAADTELPDAETGPPNETETPPERVPDATDLPEGESEPEAELTPTLDEDGVYDSKEEVALYIHLYGHLPSNYITKRQAQELGWTGGSLEPYAPGKCIGGSRFGNYEGLLPEKEGRTYTECDIDTLGAQRRGAKRIVFSNDGLIYYTDDHYESFTLLYGEEEP